MAKVVTRFAPSPTGLLHIGSARTALFSFLYAKKHGGEMILRIEDTDKERSEKKFEKDIIDGLDWLGVEFSKTYHQSENSSRHKKLLEKLVNEGKAYVSKEKEGERDEVIRLKNPGGEVVFEDLVRGRVVTDVTDLGDFVIAKSISEPIFHFANVADDHDTGVTHIIRGEDHISNTSRQILIGEALGVDRPIYAHLPLILGEDKSKLSKRHGAVSVNEYKEDYLPEALVNYLALLGWNPGDDREIFIMEELIDEFSLERVQKGGAVFNLEKLDWINKQHLAKLSDEKFLKRANSLIPTELLNSAGVLKIIRERAHKLSDITKMIEEGEFDFYTKTPTVSAEKIVWKDDDSSKTRNYLLEVISLLEGVDDFSQEKIKEKVQPLADEKGRGNVLHPMRYALSGKDRSPDPFTIGSIIGKKTTIERLNKAIELLS